VLRFYAALAQKVPGILWRTANRVLTIVGLVVVVLALLNREWSKSLADWEGFSPWWAVAAIAALFLWGLACANYEAFTEARKLAERQQHTETKLRQQEQLVALQKDEIERLQRAYNISQAQYKVLEGFRREFGGRMGD
jgi:predicted membrane chloride channel (bestrophin family)